MTESAAARLKKIRLEKGLSLEEVHKKTKIHLNILKAIEEDSLIGISPIYIKGFLKIYCKFLGVDPKDYISDYQEPRGISKEQPQALEKPPSFLKTNPLELISFRRINIKIITIIACILFLAIGLFSLGKFISSKRISRPKETKLLPSVAADKTEKRKIQTSRLKKAQKKQTAIIKEQVPELDASKNKTVIAGISLGIRAKEDCWMHLVVDGRVVFHTILKKGKFESWQAKDKIELSLGNAGVVELELNGKTIPPLGRKGQTIKNISITREEGLTVGR